jgi:hypothetical protein
VLCISQESLQPTAIGKEVSGKYSIRLRIEQIIGRELKDYYVSFDLQLALIIFQLLGEYKTSIYYSLH